MVGHFDQLKGERIPVYNTVRIIFLSSCFWSEIGGPFPRGWISGMSSYFKRGLITKHTVIWLFSNKHISISNVKSNLIGKIGLYPENNKGFITSQPVFD